jgi:hypothetical protein
MNKNNGVALLNSSFIIFLNNEHDILTQLGFQLKFMKIIAKLYEDSIIDQIIFVIFFSILGCHNHSIKDTKSVNTVHNHFHFPSIEL